MKQDRTEHAPGTQTASTGASASRGPGKTTLTAGLPQGAAPVQRKQDLANALDPESTHAAAAEGVRGSGQPLPFRDQIQASFGRHDISGIRAHIGEEAAAAGKAIGARAYASGQNIAFAGPPDLHTAAHEAAHVVQQRGGVQLKGGIGEAGDAHERNA
ncbi:MAG: DUF4157 domain-containing protein, partial [Myxococcales bacterium]|nr:DUF4157 domain-containing protein [Myxococcales bacterium]